MNYTDMFVKRKLWRRRRVSVHVKYTFRGASFSRSAEPDPSFGIAWLPVAPSVFNDHYDMKFDRKPWSVGWAIFR